jgi:hypothetical protein
MTNSTIPNVNDPKVRIAMLMKMVDKCHLKLKEIGHQKELLNLGVPCDYDSHEEIIVEVDFVINKLNSFMREVRFLGLMQKLDIPYSLN